MANIRETAKSILIAVLALSAVYLTMLTWASSGLGVIPDDSFLAGILGINSSPGALPAPEDTAGGYSGSYELPQTIVLGLQEGRYGVSVDRDELTKVFNSMRPILKEVIESASSQENTGDDEWKEALQGESAFFDLGVLLPLGIFSLDLGAKSESFNGVSTRYIAVAERDGLLSLYCKDNTGSVTRYASAVRSIAFTDTLSQYSDNGVSFAYELGADYDALKDEQVIGLKTPKTSVYRCENTFLNDGRYDDVAVSRLLEAFLFNPATVRKYSSGSGDEVFVGDTGFLTMKNDGMVVYESSGAGLPVSELTEAGPVVDEYDILNAARRLTQAANGLGGAARFTLRSLETKDGLTTIIFGLEMNGVPLMDGGRFNYGVVEVKNDCVFSAGIRYLSLFEDAGEVYILPEKQAAGIAESTNSELPFVLEKGDGKYRLTRVFRNEEG